MSRKIKCTFGESQVAYLGHIIHGAGVSVDPNKIKAVTEWPTPQSIKALRGFVSLAGYCQKFIKDNSQLATPLNMLRKNPFLQSKEATKAFEGLKKTLSTALILQLPNFNEEFVVECDASEGE